MISKRNTSYKTIVEMSKISDGSKNPHYEMLRIFEDLSLKEFKKLKGSIVLKRVSDIIDMLEEKVELSNLITLDEVVYGLIPDFRDITAGELIDLDNLSVAAEWSQILSILYRPVICDKKGKTIIDIKGRYNIEEYIKPNDKFDNVNAYFAQGAFDFFTKSFQSLNVLMTSSIQEKQKVQQTMESVSQHQDSSLQSLEATQS